MSAKAALEKNYAKVNSMLEEALQTQKQNMSNIQELDSMHQELAGYIHIAPSVNDWNF